MKATIFLLVALLCLNSCSNEKYQINGSFKGDPKEEWVYLVKVMESNPKLDSAKIVDGKFKFTGTVGYPEVYGISFHFSRIKGIFPIFLEPGELDVVINPNEWEIGSTVTGGKINEEYNKIEQIRKDNYIYEIWKLNDKRILVDKNEQDSIDKRVQELWAEDSKNQMEYIKSHLESPISIFVFSQLCYSLPLNELGNMLENFSPEIKKTAIYKRIADHYENQKSLENSTPALTNSIGLKMMNADFNKKSIIQSLANINPNRVIYVDIWGTWCVPCKKEFPFSKKLQNKLDTNKVVFVYLCIDSKEEEWEKMIKSENLKGQHFLINKEQSDSLSVEIGGLGGIPRYFIINKEGQLIDKNAPSPSSNTIEGKLAHLIQ